MERRAIPVIARWIALSGAAAIVLGAVIGGTAAALGAAGGAALALASFVLASLLLDRISRSGGAVRLGWTSILALKPAVIIGLAALLLSRSDVLGFTLGMSSLVVGMAAGAIEAHLRFDRSTA